MAATPDKITYRSYLRLPELLDLQSPLSEAHDELLFVTIHQASELWMKLCLHELEAARDHIRTDRLSPAFKMMARVARIQQQLIQSWGVLATMTPADYTAMRGISSAPRAGFQSDQYRRLEFILGNRKPEMADLYRDEPHIAEGLRDELARPSLYDEAILLLARRGFDVPTAARLERALCGRSRGSRRPGRGSMPIPRRYWDLYELAEKLVDLEYHVQLWRFGHLKTVERVIGFKTGTGGTAGVHYLAKVIEQQFFPELLSVRTALVTLATAKRWRWTPPTRSRRSATGSRCPRA